MKNLFSVVGTESDQKLFPDSDSFSTTSLPPSLLKWDRGHFGQVDISVCEVVLLTTTRLYFTYIIACNFLLQECFEIDANLLLLT